MKKSVLILALIIALTILSAFLRFYKITQNPPSLNIDEVSFGYNAYSILKTARDEYGTFLPFTFKSVGDYKNPVPIYILVPSIVLFGLNEFGVRFPTALVSVLSISIFYLFFRSVTNNTKVSLVGALLLVISPWHLFYSRYVSDHLIGTVLVVSGVVLFQRMLKGGWIWGLGSAFTLVLSMYTYYPERLFTPLLILFLLISNFKNLYEQKQKTFAFVITAVIMALPLMYLTFLGPDKARADMVFITKDIDFTRYVRLDRYFRNEIFNDSGYLLLFFYWARKLLNYFQPSFLFYNGLNMTTFGTYGLGVFYLFELPWLFLGILEVIRNRISGRNLILIWVFIGLLPASLTNNEQSAGRSLLILPPLLILSATGCVVFFKYICRIPSMILKFTAFILICGIIIWNLVSAFLVFAVHFPRQRGEAFMEGTKEAVVYALAHKDEYKEIVFDPYRGIEAPYIVGLPYMYFLFYSKYDPASYQKTSKRHGQEIYGWDKFTIRRINWPEDRQRKDVLFIGSPWAMPEQDLKQANVLKRIYLLSGDLALLVVSPKK